MYITPKRTGKYLGICTDLHDSQNLSTYPFNLQLHYEAALTSTCTKIQRSQTHVIENDAGNRNEQSSKRCNLFIQNSFCLHLNYTTFFNLRKICYFTFLEYYSCSAILASPPPIFIETSIEKYFFTTNNSAWTIIKQ